jgi:hypothetical protein
MVKISPSAAMTTPLPLRFKPNVGAVRAPGLIFASTLTTAAAISPNVNSADDPRAGIPTAITATAINATHFRIILPTSTLSLCQVKLNTPNDGRAPKGLLITAILSPRIADRALPFGRAI